MKMPMRRRGYTLLELLLVMAIILMMISLVLISVGSMLRSARMARATNFVIAAADEARTAAIALRRATRVDLTRLDTLGSANRLTVVGPFMSENFDSYNPTNLAQLAAQWQTSGPGPLLETDGSRTLRMSGLGGPASYWHSGMRVETMNNDDYEVMLQARVKFLPSDPRKDTKSIALLGSVNDNGGSSVVSAYRMNIMTITPYSGAANTTSTVSLDRVGGGTWSSGVASVEVDLTGLPSATTVLVENVWYNVILSIKRASDPVAGDRALVAGKVWADGQLEPSTWTVGPVIDKAPLRNGFPGFSVDNCDALADDVLVDMRPVRVLPPNMRVDAMDSTYVPSGVNDPGKISPDDTEYGFPLLFRPDGSTAATSVIRLTDLTSNDRRYVVIHNQTGRARIVNTLPEALKK
jgi:prepilin-type N-terminal cleavage/methylation domain-containing protein